MIVKFNFLLVFATNLFGILLFTWPLYINPDNAPLRDLSDATWISLALSLIALVVITSSISAKLMDSKTVALVAVLVALIAALRLLGAGAIGLEPMWFLLILAARAFGVEIGYAIAVVSMIVSAIITGGIGPWLTFQILAASWMALGVKIIPKGFKGVPEIAALSSYGVIAALGYGALMDMQLWPWLLGTDTQLSYQPGAAVIENLTRFFTFHLATAMAWDIPRAILTALLIAITGRTILIALRRANARMTAISSWQIASERVKVQREV